MSAPSDQLVNLLRQLKKAVEPNGFVDQQGLDAAWEDFSGEEPSREATPDVDQEQVNREANAAGGTGNVQVAETHDGIRVYDSNTASNSVKLGTGPKSSASGDDPEHVSG